MKILKFAVAETFTHYKFILADTLMNMNVARSLLPHFKRLAHYQSTMVPSPSTALTVWMTSC